MERTTKERYQIARGELEKYHNSNVRIISRTKRSEFKHGELKREQKAYDIACKNLSKNFKFFGGLFYSTRYTW